MSKLLEAYPEGADLFLVCEVHGGKWVSSWLRNDFPKLLPSICPAACTPFPQAGYRYLFREKITRPPAF